MAIVKDLSSLPAGYYSPVSVMLGAPSFAVCEGDDVAQILGITKYELPIPSALSGDVFNAGPQLTRNFDVENWESYPDTLPQ